MKVHLKYIRGWSKKERMLDLNILPHLCIFRDCYFKQESSPVCISFGWLLWIVQVWIGDDDMEIA
jgi:hypothetical protein